MLIEIHTFRLAEGADVDAFLDADRRVQTEFIPNHTGFLRRTTARADDGGWAVVTLWWDGAYVDESAALGADDPAVRDFEALIDPATVERRRYTTLD